ncbi:L domain-like protein [Piromyces finnis]|uniref:L domain-like protein n=1 Tax=Piromyces finnis TaxID=1754191 RepID=A0A1Y1V718_9FUNG|nr:L domain-like protein [Piromyces finnis]|eukprot:ORX48645.1 L domain-like protein [Piromyces finnis]
MSVSNIYSANPIEETESQSTKLLDTDSTHQDALTVKPLIQRNSQDDVRTLLNPVLIENKDDNEFSKFDEDDKLNEEQEQINEILQKERPVKTNSSSSLNTLDNAANNANQETEVSIEKDTNKNDDNDENSVTDNNNNQSSVIDEEDVNYRINQLRTVRKSLTETEIPTLNRKISFNSSSNIRNIDGKDVVVDRKYRNINCIKEDNIENVFIKEFNSTRLRGPHNINGSMELFISKHKNNKNGNSKYEIENTSFINVSRKKLEHLMFTSENNLDVRRIDASYNLIQELPRNIGIFDRLVELNISNNKLKTIPLEIGYLKELNILNLNNNEIESLPFQIGGLINLKFMYASDNKLQTFPREICRLKNLEGLYATNNKINRLPVEFIRLQKLKVLDLCNNLLFCFKFKISFLRNLEKLYLSNNQFPKLPNEITEMSNLCELYMDNNRIFTIPDEINKMKRLKILRLNNNKIQKFPDTLCENKKLRILRLQNNLIKSIPEKIYRMKNLREFNIDHNMIVDVPDTIALLPRLKKISYEGNYFSPDEIEEKVFAIGSLESANHENVERYCYRTVRKSFVQNAIENIQLKCKNAAPKNEIIVPESTKEVPIQELLDTPLETITEQMAPSIPVMIPEQANNNNNNNSNSTLIPIGGTSENTVQEEKKNQEEKPKEATDLIEPMTSSNDIKSNQIEVCQEEAIKNLEPDTNAIVDNAENPIKKEVNNLNATENNDNDATLGDDESKSQDMKSQESIKLKLIDVVLPEDLTGSQSNFIFTYEESLRGSQPSLSDVRGSQSQLSLNKKNTPDSLEKTLFKMKYDTKPSKLSEKPMVIDNSEDEKNDKKEDYVIERIPLKKGDDDTK